MERGWHESIRDWNGCPCGNGGNGGGADELDGVFRISSPSNAVITEFDAATGMIGWSNGVAGVMNQLQRSVDPVETNGWVEFTWGRFYYAGLHRREGFHPTLTGSPSSI